MNINTKFTGIALAACLSLSLMASCTASGSGSISPNNASTPDQSNGQSVSVDGNFKTSSLALQAQTALANYHSIDGAFNDSSRLAANGRFSVKQLGGLLGGDDNDDNDGSTSASTGLNVGVSTGTNTGSNDASTSTSAGVNVGTNIGTSTDSSDGSASVNTGVNVGTNIGTSTDSSNGSASTSTGVNVGTNVGTNTGNGSSSLNTGIDTSINANVDSTLNEMRQSNSRLRSNLESTGSVRFTGDNDSIIDGTRLASNVSSRVESQSDNDLRSFNDNSILGSDGNINLSGQASNMTQVSATDLGRTGNRGFNTMAGQIRSTTNADGSVTNFFGTSFNGNGTERNVLGANRVQGNTDLGTDLMLRENGNGFNTEANRVSSVNADSSLNVVTRSTTNFDNGDRIEILEDRSTSVDGSGSGNGTLTITDRAGRSETFDLRTVVRADGSLVSNLDNRNDNESDLILREDASGNASISFVGSDRGEQQRANLDFNAMLNSMSSFDFS